MIVAYKQEKDLIKQKILRFVQDYYFAINLGSLERVTVAAMQNVLLFNYMIYINHTSEEKVAWVHVRWVKMRF